MKNQSIKVSIIGLGYVGLANAVMLARYNDVICYDISSKKVDQLNNKISPIKDQLITEFLLDESLNLSATMDIKKCVSGSEYVVIAVPTNYDEDTNNFDLEIINEVLSTVLKIAPEVCVIIKSTIPIGFVNEARLKFGTRHIYHSPEFLREGKALYDNLYPSRIIVGGDTKEAQRFAALLRNAASKNNIEVIYTGANEAEAIKLFSNTYLAMRVAFFNELDSFALAKDLKTEQIIAGVSLDPRIGDIYCNPSFGYGGYCLPKDTKQLLANYSGIPQNIIEAVVKSNQTRINFIIDEILKLRPKVVGVYRLNMKSESDNFRNSAILSIIEILVKNKIYVEIYEPELENIFSDLNITSSLENLKDTSDLIIANRMCEELEDIKHKCFTRDIYGTD